MTNFLKSLLKQFHPDNKESGDKEKFIKVKDKIDKKGDLNFFVSISLKEMIYGKLPIKLGDEEFLVNNGNPTINAGLFGEDFNSKDGTKFHISYIYDNCDPDINLVLKKNKDKSKRYKEYWVKTIEISRFDAMFGGFDVHFNLYDDKFFFKIYPFTSIIPETEYKTNYKFGGLPLFIKYVIKTTDNDFKMMKKIREMYNA